MSRASSRATAAEQISAEEIEDRRREFVEGYGLVVESVGRMPRMGGRILAQLLLSEPAEQSQAQLSEAVSASPGAISTTLRMLVDRGYVKRISVPGQRTDYYRISEETWTRALEETLRIDADATRLVTRAHELAQLLGPEQERRLYEMLVLVRLEEEAARNLLELWKTSRRRVLEESRDRDGD
jgi:DNA-binding transcriptional regulator GbsR (MarR family)